MIFVCGSWGAEHYDRPELVNISAGRETSVRQIVDMLSEITAFRGEVIWDSDNRFTGTGREAVWREAPAFGLC